MTLVRNGVGTCCGLTLAVLVSSRTADAGPSNKSVAQTLFEEGRRLVASGKTTAGCEKLAESYRLDKTLGTLLNLATCHEKDGRLATAYAEFEELEAAATHDGQASRAQFARDRIAAIDPKVNKLSVVISTPTPNTRVLVDNTELPSAVWGIAAPIDPGKHTIVVAAPGRASWTREVDVSGNGRSLVVEVPQLVDTTVAAVVAPAPAAPASSALTPQETRRPGLAPLPLGLLGGGMVAIAVGGVFGAKAMASQAEARGRCERGGCDAEAERLVEDKSSSALIASVGVAAGVVAIGAGIYFLVRGGRTGGSAPAAAKSSRSGVGAAGTFLEACFESASASLAGWDRRGRRRRLRTSAWRGSDEQGRRQPVVDPRRRRCSG